MARFIPMVPEGFNGSIGEKKVFTALQLLDNNYIVFHSFRWVGMSSGRTQGEADFVIIHPKRGIMVVEVKAGGIEYKDGQWLQINTVTKAIKMINPFKQAERSKYEIKERIESKYGYAGTPLVGHAVWFTAIRIKSADGLPPEAPREIVFDELSLENAKVDIERAFDFWADKNKIKKEMNSVQMHQIIETIAPHFHAVPSLSKTIADAESSYILLTNQQVALLDYLDEQTAAVVHGLAGTGKTVLAREKARRLSTDDGKVLFLCYNSFLKEYMKTNFSQPGIVFHNAHSLAFEIMKDANVPLNELIAELVEFLEIFDVDDWPYDHVIIDEGQDLDDGLIDALERLTKIKRGHFYVFYDRNQYVMKNELPTWMENAECKLVLTKNCRNTAEIFKTSCGLVAKDSVMMENEVHGEMPSLVLIDGRDSLLKEVDRFVKLSLDAGIEAQEIVLLTLETEERSLLKGVADICKVPVGAERMEGQILFTTARKFKGLEAKAIMVIDVTLKSFASSDKRRLAYVACSRARHILRIAALNDVDSSAFGDLLNFINPDRHVPNNKKGLARLLNVKIDG
jgi:superfamily I DNA/RNA helicase